MSVTAAHNSSKVVEKVQFLYGVIGVMDKVNYGTGQICGVVSFGSGKAKKHFPNRIYPAAETDPPGYCFT